MCVLMDQRLGARTRYSCFDLNGLHDPQSSCSRLSLVFYTVMHNNGPHPLIGMARWLYIPARCTYQRFSTTRCPLVTPCRLYNTTVMTTMTTTTHIAHNHVRGMRPVTSTRASSGRLSRVMCDRPALHWTRSRITRICRYLSLLLYVPYLPTFLISFSFPFAIYWRFLRHVLTASLFS
ncbi:hypothetical protein FIBSPDRAFT_174720 [Athelia psychrophila]|uniref:Uncharacterized protein n=1 Tax=Athelia psychrophila TaxID=1759441 RepID=A0A166ANG1_9AGAM|nr:hypothetical protein FIBSPDRAFT_174720 [Fibularhizoctonia sp. CBS 109695]